MKIKIKSFDELPLNKTIEIPTITAAVRAICLQNIKYCAQVLLAERMYKR